ncbi:MAG TPA: LON peptidase substrate-binding domain-containing protein, partial [Chondromyces sp.]|nr:LON peptidase substrate-binding domain-containing protein [Chondromyces sp.]
MSQTVYTIPLLPLRGLLVYPTMVLHLDVGRERSIQALEQAMMDNHYIFLSTQKDMNVDDPTEDDLFKMGTLTKVKQMLKLPNGTIRVLVEGISRAEIQQFEEEESFYKVTIQTHPDDQEKDPESEALMRTLLEYFEQYIKLSKKVSAESYSTVADIEEPGRLADIISSHLPIKIKEKQEILEVIPVKERLQRVIELLNNEKEVLNLEKKIGQRVKRSMERT